MDTCGECGFDYEGLAVADAPSVLSRATALIGDQLEDADEVLARTRPDPSTWSALEYACHVRDVLLVQRERILLALVEDTPRFVRMYRDERVSNAGYDRETTGELVEELSMAAKLVCSVIEGLSVEQQQRGCIYNNPEATRRDVGWLVRHTTHEVVHHEMDVRKVLESAVRIREHR